MMEDLYSRLLAYRSVDELDRVKGLGKKRLEEIRPLFIVE